MRRVLDRRIMEGIYKFLNSLNGEIPIHKAILFGSYAKGTANNDSDVDIAIFSDYFLGKESMKCMAYLLHKANEACDIDIQPWAFLYQDYLTQDNFFVKEIIETGIEV